MIESITLRDFQIHRLLKIRFDERVSFLIGESDKGKSSVMRAIEWVCTNQPSGQSFIRKGASKTSVSLRVDGRTIRRVKGKGINSYFLDKREFKAFGSRVPEEILSLLRTSTYNFQGQMDPHFWFSLSPPQVGRELNRLVDLEHIDRSLSKMARILKEAGSRHKISQERLKEAEEELASLSFLDEALVDLGEIEETLEQIDDIEREIEDLERRAQEIEIAQEQALVDYGPASIEAKEILSLMKEASSLEEEAEQILSITQRLEEKEKESCEASRLLRLTMKKERRKIEGSSCPLCGSEILSLSSVLTST